jgi:hypothetical protein
LNELSLRRDRDAESVDGVYLLWIPLGAGGNGFVRWNGRLYETMAALRQGRDSQRLFHTALDIGLGDDRMIVENAWPSPDDHLENRGVVLTGPVFHQVLGRFRPFRYEVRCWRNGSIADAPHAVDIDRVGDASLGRAIVDLVPKVPQATWGRDVFGTGDMWNSNSVIAFLLAAAGIDMGSISAPAHGRAPGWVAGITAASEDRGPVSRRRQDVSAARSRARPARRCR